MKAPRTRLCPTLGLLSALVLLACAVPARAAHLSSYEPAPRGLILISRPTIVWPLFLGAGTVIDTISLTLNGESQPIAYDSTNQLCTSPCTTPLPAGDYLGRINLTFKDGSKYEKDWQFSVSPDAKSDFPSLDEDQQAAAAAVNAYRKQCGLPEVVLNPALGAAADAHSRYMNQNKQYGHREVTALAGFTGVSPEDRVLAWGYALGDYEDISFATEAVSDVVKGLFDAPYHRVAFLQQGAPDFGYSAHGGRATLEFGMTSVTGETVYPADGERNVPVSWTNDEYPDPLRIHPGAARIVGYPISLYCYGTVAAQITVETAALTRGDGTDVPIYYNRDANDTDLHGGVIIFPQSPLDYGTRYTVTVKGADVNGHDISRIWSFTTMDAVK